MMRTNGASGHRPRERVPGRPTSLWFPEGLPQAPRVGDGDLRIRSAVPYGDEPSAHDRRGRLTVARLVPTTNNMVLDPLGRMAGKLEHPPDGDAARACLRDTCHVVLGFVLTAGGSPAPPGTCGGVGGGGGYAGSCHGSWTPCQRVKPEPVDVSKLQPVMGVIPRRSQRRLEPLNLCHRTAIWNA